MPDTPCGICVERLRLALADLLADGASTQAIRDVLALITPEEDDHARTGI